MVQLYERENDLKEGQNQEVSDRRRGRAEGRETYVPTERGMELMIWNKKLQQMVLSR